MSGRDGPKMPCSTQAGEHSASNASGGNVHFHNAIVSEATPWINEMLPMLMASTHMTRFS